MRIGILGTGHMGTTLGGLWAKSGHQIMYGSRDTARGAAVGDATNPPQLGGSVTDAAQYGEAILLAVPWHAIPATIAQMGSIPGKIVIDCTNPLAPGDGTALLVGHTTSAAETIAGMTPDAHVVKAFNAVIYHVLQVGPQFGTQTASLFYCGDHDEANAVVAALIRDTGFAPVACGPLRMARALEPLATLIIELGYGLQMGPQIAMTLLQR